MKKLIIFIVFILFIINPLFSKEISIDDQVKSKLEHHLSLNLIKVKEFKASQKRTADRRKMENILGAMSKGIIIDYKEDEPTVDVLIKTTNANEILNDQIIIDGVFHKGNTGDFVAATVKMKDLEFLTQKESVIGIEPSYVMYPELDQSVGDINADIVWNGNNNIPDCITGEGVYVGIIDGYPRGTHITFEDDNGNSRIIEKYNYDNTTESNHGTHVGGIAAGRGNANDNFRGIAYESEILFGDNGFGNVEDMNGSNEVLESFQDMIDKATNDDKPLVVNLSAGTQIHPHDGSTYFEQVLNSKIENNIIFVKSAGNDGGTPNIHFSGTVPLTGTLEFDVNVPSGYTYIYNEFEIEIWYANGLEFDVRVKGPNGNWEDTWVEFGEEDDFDLGLNAGDESVQIYNSDGTMTYNSNNNDNVILLEFYDPWPGDVISIGDYSIELKPHNSSNGGNIDAYSSLKLYIDNNNDPDWFRLLDFTNGDTYQSISLPGYASDVTTVAAMWKQNVWTNHIASFSSKGPSRKGTISKPDITAPGVSINSSIATGNTVFDDMSGTSMAAPHVTGCIALLLQNFPDLTADDCKQILQNAAASPGANFDQREWGAGKLDILAAYESMVGFIYGGNFQFKIKFEDTFTQYPSAGLPIDTVETNWNNMNIYVQDFSNGAITYHSNYNKAYWIGSGIWAAYSESQTNGTLNYILLGIPLSSEDSDPDNNNFTTVNFENGEIYWNDNDPNNQFAVVVLYNYEVIIQKPIQGEPVIVGFPPVIPDDNVTIKLSVDDEIGRGFISGLEQADFIISVGLEQATISDFEENADEEYYLIEVEPPIQDKPGLYNLTVDVDHGGNLGSANEFAAVLYSRLVVIEKGLSWLRTVQGDNGSWKYSNDNVGITSLVLQAFSAAGYTNEDSDVAEGISYLLSRYSNGQCYDLKSGYETAMFITALRSLDKWNEIPQYGEYIQAAQNKYITTQHSNGGWRYNLPYSSSDLSVTQWPIIALEGVDNDALWNGVLNFIHSVRNSTDGGYGYSSPSSTPTLTCAGIWGEIVAGGPQSNVTDAFNYITDNFNNNLQSIVSYTSSYAGYYKYSFAKACALAGRTQLAGDNWYEALSNHLEDIQDDNGSWDSNQMTTAFHLLSLEVGTVPPESKFIITLSTSSSLAKSTINDFKSTSSSPGLYLNVYDSEGNYAGPDEEGNWITTIPNSRWIFTGATQQLEVELEKADNFSIQIQNIGSEIVNYELLLEAYMGDNPEPVSSTSLEGIAESGHNYGTSANVNAIGGLSVYSSPIVVYPVMTISPTQKLFSPIVPGRVFNFTFDINETGGDTIIYNTDIFADNLADDQSNIISLDNIVFTPTHIDTILPDSSKTVSCIFTIPDDIIIENDNVYVGKIHIESTNGGTKKIDLIVKNPAMDLSYHEKVFSPILPGLVLSFQFDIIESGGGILNDVDVTTTSLINEWDHIIPATSFNFSPDYIDVINSGDSVTISGSITIPSDVQNNTIYEGKIYVQSLTQQDSIKVEVFNINSIFSEGWNQVSIPYQPSPSDPVSVFEEFIDPFYTQPSYSNIYSWSEQEMMYEVPKSLKIGDGFWLKSWYDSTVVEIIGVPYSGSSKTFNLSKHSGLYWQTGWHMIGSPFLAQVDFEYAVLDSVDNIYYKWDPETKSYTFYPGGGKDQYIQPWEAVWVHAKDDGASITLSSQVFGKKTAPKEFEPLWEAQLTVSTDTYKDDKNYFGVSPDASNGFDDIPIDIPEVNLPMAPGMTEFVNLSFYHDDWDEYSGKYARDIIYDNPESKNWDIIVTASDTVGNATITCDNIFAIPEEYEVFLYDLGKNRLLNDFRSFPCYTFSLSSMNKTVSDNSNIFLPGISDDSGYFTRFLIVVEKPPVIPEHFYLSQNYPNPFNNLTNIKFGVPYPAHIKVEVYNLLGQKIETLCDEYMDAGSYSESFNAERYSSGIYFCILVSKDYRHVIKMAFIK